MPQPFKDAVMTDKGAALLARAQAGECQIIFTRMSTGDGEYTEEEKTVEVLKQMTELKSLKNDFNISVVGIVNDTTVRVVSQITNQDLNTGEALITEGYYINEIGLFASDDSGNEVLYSIAVTAGDQGDYIPEFDGYNPAQITQEYYATVDNSANVTLVVSNSTVMLSEIYDPAGGGKQVAFEEDMLAQIEAAIAEANAAIDSAVTMLETMLTNGSVTKLGTDTVGGASKPIYLNSGTPTAISNTIGSTSKPVYVNAGTLTALSSTIGSTTKPVYVNAGALTAFSNTIGGTNQPMYLNAGAMTACNSMVPQSGGVTMSGNLVGPTATDYTTSRFRNARFGTSAPSSLNNGEIYFVYE